MSLIPSKTFLPSEVALYFFKYTIVLCMEYFCHAWSGTPKGYLDMLNKLQKQAQTSLGLIFAASLESSAHHWNLTSLRLFYYFCSDESKLAKLVPRSCSCMGSTRYFSRVREFYLTITRFYKYVYTNILAPPTAWFFYLQDVFLLIMILMTEVYSFSHFLLLGSF